MNLKAELRKRRVGLLLAIVLTPLVFGVLVLASSGMYRNVWLLMFVTSIGISAWHGWMLRREMQIRRKLADALGEFIMSIPPDILVAWVRSGGLNRTRPVPHRRVHD